MKRVVVLLVAAVVLLAGCGKSPPSGQELGEAGCTPIGQVCRLAAPQGGISLHFADGVSPLTPFSVEVTTTLPAEAVSVSFEMVGMDMGPNRNRLAPKGEVWEGRAVLPVCVTGRTDWVATVEIRSGDGLFRGRFPFTTD